MSNASRLLILLLCRQKTPKVQIVETDTGISSYFYMVKTKEGKVRRMETMASSLEQAQGFAEKLAASLKGKLLTKVKLARKYSWQRPLS